MATKYFVAWQKREEVLEDKEHISFDDCLFRPV